MLKKLNQKNPKLSFKQVLVKAKESYKRNVKGGAYLNMPLGIKPTMRTPPVIGVVPMRTPLNPKLKLPIGTI